MTRLLSRLVGYGLVAVSAGGLLVGGAGAASATSDNGAAPAGAAPADCSAGAIADVVDPRPNSMYGAGWVNCQQSVSRLTVMVSLYQGGQRVGGGRKECATPPVLGCGANTDEIVDQWPGLQPWQAQVWIIGDWNGEAWSGIYEH
ncbi:hypothetical protein [Amycolatopsis nigrescens]|uniref:hypothetical protein n=1 Tax=Amycolatopsis nigrescens TaxID=381445 RepID=UPI0012F71605|nr:hypothetical protein [Amycolatopsis nigrescens]